MSFVTEGQLVRAALGPEWCNLSDKTQKRFETDPDTPVEYSGVMSEISASFAGKLFALMGKLFGSPLLLHSGIDIPIEVVVYKKPECADIFKKRTYYFPNRSPVIVETRMHLTKTGGFIEYADLGMGMMMNLNARNGVLYFYGQQYVLNIGIGLLPIPTWLSPGIAVVEHSDYGVNQFRVRIEMRHPWFGVTFVQDGVFQEKKLLSL